MSPGAPATDTGERVPSLCCWRKPSFVNKVLHSINSMKNSYLCRERQRKPAPRRTGGWGLKGRAPDLPRVPVPLPMEVSHLIGQDLLRERGADPHVSALLSISVLHTPILLSSSSPSHQPLSRSRRAPGHSALWPEISPPCAHIPASGISVLTSEVRPLFVLLLFWDPQMHGVSWGLEKPCSWANWGSL